MGNVFNVFKSGTRRQHAVLALPTRPYYRSLLRHDLTLTPVQFFAVCSLKLVVLDPRPPHPVVVLCADG